MTSHPAAETEPRSPAFGLRSPRSNAAGPRARPRASWQPRSVLTVGAALAAVLLAVFAYVLANSQQSSRHEVEQRFLAQATIAAGLTRAIFSTADAPQMQAAARQFGGARIDPRALTDTVRRSGLAYAYIVGPRGRLLAHSAGAPAMSPFVAADAVVHAIGGAAWFSNLVPGANGYLIDQVIPVASRFGPRVEVLGYPAASLSGFLGSYLVGALPDRTAEGFVLDGAGRVVASSVAGTAIGSPVSHQMLAILESARAATPVQGAYDVPGGPLGGTRYFAAAPIGGSDWRVGITESTGTLYPADIGSQWWVIWIVFVAFALAAGGCLLLLRRSLGAAGRLVEQAREVDAANAALQATNAELNAFSYSVSHDLRAPLRAIDGFSRIVMEDETGLSESQQRYLGLVRENTRIMGTLIDDLLSFSRLATQPIERRTVDVGAIVGALEAELARDEPTRTIEFDNGALPVVEADPALVRQVFANLLGNAVKYTRSRPHARIAVAGECRDGELVYSVADNGVGFDERYADKLFQVFQRLHRAEDYEGTGVGLALVQRIVTRHGGRVWAEGRPDEGATFHVTFKEPTP